MQGLHHQQQQLAALLTVALPKEDPSKSTSTSTTSAAEDDESSRVAAITSLKRAILYPPNSLLITHSASFLAQGFSQLLSDKYAFISLSFSALYLLVLLYACHVFDEFPKRNLICSLPSLLVLFEQYCHLLMRNHITQSLVTQAII